MLEITLYGLVNTMSRKVLVGYSPNLQETMCYGTEMNALNFGSKRHSGLTHAGIFTVQAEADALHGVRLSSILVICSILAISLFSWLFLLICAIFGPYTPFPTF